MKISGIKRKTALALALAMMLSLLPSVAFAESESIVYEFNNKTVISKVEGKPANPGKPANWEIAENAGWNVDTKNSTENGSSQTYKTHITQQVYLASNGNAATHGWIEAAAENLTSMQLVINAELSDAGWYDVEFTGAKAKQSGAVYIYADGQYAGYYDFYNPDLTLAKAKIESLTLNSIYLTPESGSVKIMLAKEDGYYEKDGKTRVSNINPSKITLRKREEKPSLEKIEIKSPAGTEIDDNIVIYSGETLDFTAEALMDNGIGFAYNGYSDDRKGLAGSSPLNVTLEEEGVVAYSSPDDLSDGVLHGKLSPVAVGKTKVTVSATVNVGGGEPPQELTREITVEVKNPPKFDKAEISLDKESLPVTRAAKATISLLRDDGENYTGEYSVEYSVHEEDVGIVTIDKDGNITALSEGTARIIAKVTTPEGEDTAEKTLTVTAAPTLASISAEAGNVNLIPGEETDITVEAGMNDGLPGNISGYVCEYESSDTDVITVDENGHVFAVGTGTASVIASVQNESGKTLFATVSMTVTEPTSEIVLDFNQSTVASNPDTNGGARAAQVVSGVNWQIVPERSTVGTIGAYSTLARIAAYIEGSTSENCHKNWLQAVNDVKNKGMFTVKTKVPEGAYRVKLICSLINIAGMAGVYVDGQYMGVYDGYNEESTKYASAPAGEEKNLGNVYITPDDKGYAEISFVLAATSDGKTPGDGRNEASDILLTKLTLTPVGKMPEVAEIEIDMDNFGILSEGEEITLPKNAEVDFTARVKMTDGTYKELNGYKVDFYANPRTATEDPDNAITAAASGDAVTYAQISNFKDSYAMYETGGQFGGKITSVENGAAQLTVTAKVSGKPYIKTVNITVSDKAIAKTTGYAETKTLFVGDSVRLLADGELEDGSIIADAFTTNVFSSDSDCVLIDNVSGRITALKVGTATVKVETTYNGITVDDYFEIEILPEGMTEIKLSAGGSQHIRLSGIENEIVPLYVTAISNIGRELDLANAEITAVSENPEVATIDNALNITPVSEGEVNLTVTVKLNGRERTVTAPLTVSRAKSGSTYYTKEKLDAVRENVKLYDWAKNTMETNMEGADFYLTNLDGIYDLIHSEGLPRIRAIGIEADENKAVCKYCGTNLLAEYGSYPWVHNALQRPWQIQCPDCRRLFPSNDFGSFYELGLNEYGEFDHQRALDAHHRLVHHGSPDAVCSCTAPVASTEADRSAAWYEYYGYGNSKGYLYNELYKDVDTSEIAFFRPGEKLETWGVDDGFGYIPLKEDGKPYMLEGSKEVMTPERHTYIAEYLFHGLWRRGSTKDTNGGMVIRAVQILTNAYYYTGDVKYGRALAVLTDRIADFYEDFDMTRYEYEPWRSSDTCQGKLLNHVWENGNAKAFSKAYDITYDLYDDPWVLDYIKTKEKTVKFRDAKETPSQIRTHIEDGILRGGLMGLTGENAAVKGRGLIAGNFGYPQDTNAVMAVVLDTHPETEKWLDYLMASGWNRSNNALGGGINERLVNAVDRDGQGNEASAYNNAWHTSLIGIADTLSIYGYDEADLYNNPKFVRMFYATVPLIAGYYTPQIGDSASTLATGHWMSDTVAIAGWQKLKDPLFAKILYYLNGNKADGLHYAIDVKNPEKLEKEVQRVIDEEGEFVPDSHMMTGFGFSILQDGGDYTGASAGTAKDTRRNVWMYFGSADGHGHKDTLNLGMTAYGLNFMPDNGYPEETGMQPNRLQWAHETLAHNTVMVNEKSGGSNTATRSKSKHFDDAGMVQLMDVDAPEVYKDITDTYRRSVLMIKVDDEISYAVDFFRILGGNDHLYSFHASSDEIAETAGLTMIPQLNDEGTDYYGTYVGRKVEYVDPVTKKTEVFDPAGATEDPYSPQLWTYNTVFPRGYTWLDKVDRDLNPSEKFEIDFRIKDFNKAIKDSSGLRLRMTMLDGGNRDGREVSVATVNGYPPNKADNKNIPFFRYVLVKHSAKNEKEDLDTTFTTVFEPYRNTRYLKNISELAMTPVSGKKTASDAYKAVRIEHESGRVDYVFYATNNAVTYEVEIDDDKKLSFSGFAGVYTVQNGENTYKYLHDGTVLGESTGANASIEGIVSGFTDDLVFDNYITITPNRALAEDEVKDTVGRYVFIDNGDKELNGSYKIESATYDGKKLTLGIGLVTTVKAYRDAMNFDAGYVHSIGIGQSARIPLTYREENKPEFTSVPENITVSAGSSVSANVSAQSPLPGVGITYKADTLPRGASLDTVSGVITWKPDKSQVGDHHVAITAVDTFGRENTSHFMITVYGSTTGNTSTDSSGTAGESTGSAGGGGGGGGAAPTDKPEDENDTSGVNDGENAPDASGETNTIRFTDLSNHAWAADAINSLAADGIIKGTSASTFSPASNITRADFALLLVRAFELKSDNAENFADVSADDYFASELAIARNTGIVNGIGDNKYAPRNTITRQDMMVIVYRALSDLPEGEPSVAEQYHDFVTVAPYAKEAVSALISAGLVNGKNGLIAPLEYTTRAEVAVLLRRVLDNIK